MQRTQTNMQHFKYMGNKWLYYIMHQLDVWNYKTGYFFQPAVA